MNINSEQKQLQPAALQLVAILFIVGGSHAAIEIYNSIILGKIHLHFGILGIPIGWGLLRLRNRWRIWALVSTGLSLVLTAIGLVFTQFVRLVDFNILGVEMGNVDAIYTIPFFALFIIYLVWQYKVLTRENIVSLFQPDPNMGGKAVVSSSFSRFLQLHPEFKMTNPKLQWKAFHNWFHNTNQDNLNEDSHSS